MERFNDVVGYVYTKETEPGIYEGVVVEERLCFGEVKELSSRWEKSENINDDFKLNHEIEIVMDAFAYNHFSSIKYIRWMGVRWKVTGVKVRRPRLILSLGGEYNGILPESQEFAGDSRGS